MRIRKYLKRGITVILTFAMILILCQPFSDISFSPAAELKAEGTDTADSEEVPSVTDETYDYNDIQSDNSESECTTGGLQDSYHAPDAENSDFYGAGALSAQSAMPSSYSLRDDNKTTEVKNQGSFPVCWAFAAAANMESNSLIDGTGTQDLSELHTAYYSYNNTESDTLGFTAGDTLVSTPYALHLGRARESIFDLADWRGPVADSILPYSSASLDLSSPDIAYTNDAAHLQNAYYINIAENPDIVKQLITSVGSASLSYCSDGGNWSTSKYYNSKNIWMVS